MDPSAIRAACAEKGVPCVGEEKPKTVTVAHGAGTMRFDRLTTIATKLTAEDKPGLFVVGAVCGTDGATFTTTPLADIQRQAAAAGIELPPVTVVLDGNGWKSIEKVTCRTPEGKLRTVVYGDGGDAYVDLAPAQVVALCALAGWPKPQVRCVFTYASGDPCEVDPADIQNAEYDAAFHATRVQMRNEYMYLAHYVREPVAVVEAMRAACKEGE